MSISIKFLSSSRDDLFDVSQRMVKALDPERLTDPRRPLVISVRGSWGAGKKIFPDAARDALLGSDASFKGQREYAEFWTGFHANKPLEVDFLNAAWGWTDHRSHYGFRQKTRVRNFLGRRQQGGVSFVHNCQALARTADIDICVEEPHGTPTTYRRPQIFNAPLGMQRTFNTLAKDNEWARYIELTVNCSDLQRAPRFRAFLDSLKASDEQPDDKPSITLSPFRQRFVEEFLPEKMQKQSDDSDMGNKYLVPVYGSTIPRPIPAST